MYIHTRKNLYFIKNIIIYLGILFVAIALPLFVSFGQITYPERPMAFVSDYANVLGDTILLEEKIKKFEKETSNEIAVVTIDSLEGVTIEEYAVNLFEKWGIGKAGKDNGVLLLVAIKDRQVRIEVGYGLEGALPDSLAGSIIRNEITPFFEQENYQEGVERGVEAIMAATKGEYKVKEKEEKGSAWVFLIVFLVIVGFIVLFARFGRKGKGGVSGTTYSGRTYTGGGDFSGFGGGSSGGGGASGRW